MDGQDEFSTYQSPPPVPRPGYELQQSNNLQPPVDGFEDLAKLQRQQPPPPPQGPEQRARQKHSPSPPTPPPHPRAEPFPTNLSHLTTIDGQNMWRNWKRNFSSPLMAIWDLVDNAFDAAEPMGGRLQVFADQSFDTNGVNAAREIGTASSGGLVMMNTSDKEIKHIDKILKPYSSSKTDSQDAIGENGIGVKQAAATLADLSFVMTKNDPKMPSGSTTISFGIVAKNLQNSNGVFFPSMQMEVPCSSTLEKNNGHADHAIEQGFKDFVSKFGADVQTVLGQYGGCGGAGGGQGDFGCQIAIKRLAFHIKNMIFSPKWRNSKYVFCMIIHHLLHGGSEDGMNSTTQLEQLNNMLTHRANQVQEKSKAWTLMEQIQQEAPRQYLHVHPSFTFEIGVNGDHVQFSHWQRRMAEFTRFVLPINKKEDINNKDNMPMSYFEGLAQAQTCSLQSPVSSQVAFAQRQSPTKSVTQPSSSSSLELEANNIPGADDTQIKFDSNTYSLQVYCGFDTLQVGERDKNDCVLLIYSRKSGRLVKVFNDARSFLGLNNTSDFYCQGFTIIVDDKDGMLPLNPTKQDLAFSEQAYGAIHLKNMRYWVKAAAKCFYDYHLKKFNGKKNLLRQGVISLCPKAQELVQDEDNHDLQGTLDNFPILSMIGLKAAFHRGHFKLRFDGFGGTALMRFHYPAVQELNQPKGAPKSNAPPSRKRQEAKAAAMGLTLAQYEYNTSQLQEAPQLQLKKPAKKKRKTGDNGLSLDSALEIDLSPGIEDEAFDQKRQQQHNEWAENQLQEARNEVTRLRAEQAAINSQHQDKTKDLEQEKKNLAVENKELKELIIEMRDKKNDYKGKYKKSQREIIELKRRLADLEANGHFDEANGPDEDRPNEVKAHMRFKEE